MKLIPVDSGVAPVRSEYKKILTDFVESEEQVSEVTEYDTSLSNVVVGLRKTAERHDMPVRVFQRKGRVFLVRTEQL